MLTPGAENRYFKRRVVKPLVVASVLILLTFWFTIGSRSSRRFSNSRDASPLVSDNQSDQGNGAANAVAVQGEFAYVGVGRRLVIVDVSERSKPAVVGRTVPLSNGSDDHVRDVAVLGKYALVALLAERSGRGVVVIDVSNSTGPRKVGVLPIEASALAIALKDGYAYVYTSRNLEVVDISDPTNPRKAGSCKMEGSGIPYWGKHAVGGEFVALSGNYAYVADQAAGMQVLDVSDPSAPHLFGNYTPAESSVVSRTSAGGVVRRKPSVLSVAILNQHAYITVGRTSLRILDVSDPTRPKEVGSCEIAPPGRGGAVSVAVHRDHAYVYDVELHWGDVRTGGVTIVDVSDPKVPTILPAENGPTVDGNVLDCELHGESAYLCDGEKLFIADIAETRRLTVVGSVNVGSPRADQ